MQHRSLARWLVVGVLAAFVLLTGASVAFAQDTEVQGTNTSSDTTGASGDVAVTNTATVQGGPSSAAADGSVSATQMNGDTNANLGQNTSGASGPAVAGSTVATPGAGSDTQTTNVSSGDTAISGPVLVSSDAAVIAGPSSVSDGAGSVATTGQNGDVGVFANQTTIGSSGPASAGSVFVTGDNGDALTQGTNVSSGGLALSGGADVFNALVAAAGPASFAFDGGIATTGVVGDNDAFLTQSAIGRSGAATVGVLDIVNSSDDVQGTNVSTDNVAFSGFAITGNALTAAAGPVSSATGGGAVSSTNQHGDATVVANQQIGASSGNSIVGSVLIGLSSAEDGFLNVVDQQASDPDFQNSATQNEVAAGDIEVQTTNVTEANVGFTGNALAFNEGVAVAGPASTSSSVAAGAGATAGDAVAVTTMDGNTDTFATQTGNARSGDLLLASQNVDANAGAGAVVDVQDFNEATGNFGETGTAFVLNAGTAFSGPTSTADSSAVAAAGATAVSGDVVATASQDGDTFADLRQVGDATTGSAIVASQNEVLDARSRGAGSDATGATISTQNTNVADFGIGVSGSATSVNDGFVVAGPAATAASEAAATDTSDATAGDAVATITQDGSDDARLTQNALTSSGAVTSGSQSNVVSARPSDAASGTGFDPAEVDIQNANVATAATAISGDASVTNVGIEASGGLVSAGSIAAASGTATATAGDATGTSSQDGDNFATGTQLGTGRTGDVSSGSQESDIEAGSVVSVEDVNVATVAIATSGDADVTGFIAGSSGPSAAALSDALASADGAASSGDAVATVEQVGDNDSFQNGTGSASSGGSLAGGQRNLIDARRAEVSTLDTNVADAVIAASGDASVVGDLIGSTGPVAIGESIATAGAGGVDVTGAAVAVAEQDGDNLSLQNQLGTAATGRTVAGSQDKHIRATDNVVETELVNIADGALAASGDAAVLQVFFGATGTSATAAPTGLADATAVAEQEGDNLLRAGQIANVSTGNAGAGSIILADAGSEDELFQLTNATAASVALTGNSFGANFGFAAAGTPAVSLGGVAVVATTGGNSVDSQQVVTATSGIVLSGVLLAGDATSAFGAAAAALAGGFSAFALTPTLGTSGATVTGEHASLVLNGETFA